MKLKLTVTHNSGTAGSDVLIVNSITETELRLWAYVDVDGVTVRVGSWTAGDHRWVAEVLDTELPELPPAYAAKLAKSAKRATKKAAIEPTKRKYVSHKNCTHLPTAAGRFACPLRLAAGK